MKLTFELVPAPLWEKNLRSLLSREQWNLVRRAVYRASGYRCVVCGHRGNLSCHEVWEYDDETFVQTLQSLIALCPDCHLCKHPGFAEVSRKTAEMKAHFLAINGCTEDEYQVYADHEWDQWQRRNAYEWTQKIPETFTLFLSTLEHQ